jgi:RNA-directed DNA polymerase
MSAMSPSAYEWKNLPWRKLERQVFKLQKRIYQASRRGELKTVHRLQRLLMNSGSARVLAVRRVTQDNRGKNTAGIDGVKSLTPVQRMALAEHLTLPRRATPTRRVWLPKPGTQEKRPLSVPVIHDRAAQALVKLALEPEWEAHFEPNSYGFRPGRSAQDAIVAIHGALRWRSKYVLDTDIAQCFDSINHTALLDKLATFPRLRRRIKDWLKAGVIDHAQFTATTQGAPQGGVLSPLLMNVALHGLEAHLRAAFPKEKRDQGRLLDSYWKPQVIRYADDFVVLHSDRTVIEQCQQLVNDWLKPMGLQLKPSKTRITHTLETVDGQVGFDFLGFHVQQYKVGKTHSRKGFIALITPAKEAVQRHYRQLAAIVDAHKCAPQYALIMRLNSVIRGWCNYYATQVSSRTFSKLRLLLYGKLRRWANRRHPHKSGQWISRKYWTVGQADGKWTFATPEGLKLLTHSEIPIHRHVKVQGERSPYDGNFAYWATRRGQDPMLPRRIARLLKLQAGKCRYCGLYFQPEDLIELDHVLPKVLGGATTVDNSQLLHRHCHDQKTAGDGSLDKTQRSARRTNDNGQVVEEPCAGKLARTVLKPSGRGDPFA